MRRKLISLPILALALLAQACSDKGASTPANESAQVTQTRMNEIDNLEGTISDEMIITDDSNDEAELESANDAKSDAPKPPVIPRNDSYDPAPNTITLQH
jgi:hypothetical protein